MSASPISKSIFEIKATEDKTNIYTPMFSVSGKNVVSFGSLAASLVVLLLIPAQADHEVLSLNHHKGEVNLRHIPKSKQNMLMVSD